MGLKEKDILKRVLFYGGNAIVALIFVSPLLWMIAASLKPEAQIFSDMSTIRTFWPTAAALGNYVEGFTRGNMMKFILNSLFYVFVIVILDLAVNSVCGYALAKFDFPGKELLLTVVISLMVLPMEAIMLPLYKEVASLGWVNTWAGLIVPFVGKCFSVYMFRQFFLDIPDDLLEAAAIDGCGPIKTFFTIVMPISGTVYATIFILDFVAHWNDFMWPMLVVTGEDNPAGHPDVLWLKANTLWSNYGVPDHIGNPHAADVRISSEILRGRYCIHWHKGIEKSWQ